MAEGTDLPTLSSIDLLHYIIQLHTWLDEIYCSSSQFCMCHRFVGIFRFVSDPNEKWQLVIACLGTSICENSQQFKSTFGQLKFAY